MKVRKGKVSELDQIYKIYRDNGQYFGFVSKVEIVDAIVKSCLHVVEHNNEIVGFVLFTHRRDGVNTIQVIAVSPDIQRGGIGSMLIDSVPLPIRLKCIDGTHANEFYIKHGFELVGKELSKVRELNIYYKPNPKQRKLF